MKTIRRKATKRRPAKRYPAIPAEVEAPGGRVSVEVADGLDDKKNEDEIVMGHYHMIDRTIRVRRKMRREQQWRTYFHELTHLWLSDAGLSNGLPGELEEGIADAIASGMMRERFG